MPGWGAFVPEEEYKAHIANYVDQPEVCVKYTFIIKSLSNSTKKMTDKYMRVPARRHSPSGYSIITWICGLWHCVGDMFPALPGTQERSW